jgi:hypothetical protein
MEQGWSWNPVSWVFVPVKCALAWAFVPDAAVVSQTLADNGAAWGSSPVGTFVTASTDALSPIVNMGSGVTSPCGGLDYAFPLLPGQPDTHVHLLDSCTAPMNNIAPIVKGILTVVVLAYGVYGIVRLVGAALGWNIGKLPEWEQGSMF